MALAEDNDGPNCSYTTGKSKVSTDASVMTKWTVCINVLAPTIGESGIGKEPTVEVAYPNSFCSKKFPAKANPGGTLYIPPESETPGYKKGVPMDVIVDRAGCPESVDKGMTPPDETGDPDPSR